MCLHQVFTILYERQTVVVFFFAAQADLRNVLRRTFTAPFTYPNFLVKTLHYSSYFLLYQLQENQKLLASQDNG